MAPPAGWFRVQDNFFTDDKLATLIADGRHDAVVLYFAAIAWSHAQDTDGVLPHRARRMLIHSIHTDEATFELLVAIDLIRSPRTRSAMPAYTIGGYGKWQTSSEQRKEHASVMRQIRSRDKNGSGHVTELHGGRDSFSREEREERDE